MELIGLADPSLGLEPSPLHAAVCRVAKKGDTWALETWAQELTLGQPLPTLPLWLASNLAVPLELEESYEETCRVLPIPWASDEVWKRPVPSAFVYLPVLGALRHDTSIAARADPG
jgi:hypothetical protein